MADVPKVKYCKLGRINKARGGANSIVYLVGLFQFFGSWILVAFGWSGSRMSSSRIQSDPFLGWCSLAAKRIPVLAIAGLDLIIKGFGIFNVFSHMDQKIPSFKFKKFFKSHKNILTLKNTLSPEVL